MEHSEQQQPGSAGGPRKLAKRGHGVHHWLELGRRARRRITWRIAVVAGIVVLAFVAGVVALLMFTELDWAALVRPIGNFHPVPLFAAMALLPLAGFPIMPVYLIAGARFGTLGGGAVVALATVVHLIGSYVIARTIFRRPLDRLLNRWHAHLPEIPRDEEAAVAVVAALVPGVPYFVRNYLLAMTGVRLSVYFWICLPIHVARSYVSIMLGDLGNEPDGTRFIIIAGVEVLKVTIVALVLFWLRQHHRKYHASEHA